jgi:multisubunit Na+/H+ antiporter MnhC subunit
MRKKMRFPLLLFIVLVAAVFLTSVVPKSFSFDEKALQSGDIKPPSIAISTPRNVTYSVNHVALSIAINENPYWIGYCLDERDIVTVSGNTMITDLSDGTHSLTVYANDSAGNMGQSKTVYFTIDTRPPVIMLFSPQNKTYATNAVLVNVTSDETVSWIGYSLDGQVSVAVPENMTLSELTDGTHSLVVYVKDAAGNVGTSETIIFSIAANDSTFQLWILSAIVVILAVGATILVYVIRARRSKPSDKLMETSEAQ